MDELLFRSIDSIPEEEMDELKPFDLTPSQYQMPALEQNLRTLLEEANASGAFASVGSSPIKGGIKLEFYFTLRIPATQLNQ